MNTIKIITGLLIAVGLILTSGCADFLDENPPHIMTPDKLFTSVDGYESGINGLYALMRQEREGYRFTSGFGNVGLRAIVHLAGTDNVAVNTKGELSNIMADWKKSNVTTDPGLKSLYSWLYQVVNSANMIIIRAEKSDINWGNDETKYRIIAEARLARAWAYRHLTYLWGNVPLVLTEPSGSNIRTDYTRDPVAEIRKVMISDLRYAQERLPWKPAKTGHASKGVALTYLAEIYLAVNKPDSALFFANKCIDEGPYKLITNRYGAKSQNKGVAFMDMFQPENVDIEKGNTEALWVMQWQRNVVGGGDNLMRHETVIRYQNERNNPTTGNLNNYGGNIIIPTEERGGRGWNRTAITPYALYLYNLSSDPAAGLIDERGSEYAVKKYFVLSDADSISKTINGFTNKRWAIGDTVWIRTVSATGSYGRVPWDKTRSGANNFELLLNVGSNNIGRTDWPFSLKFAFCDAGYPTTTESHQNQMYMRLSETILLKAEALLRLGRTGEAADEINKLRDRAHAKRVTAEEMSIDLIVDERSRELILEEQRRYTLLRMGGQYFYDRVTRYNTKNLNLQLRDTLYPIPQSVIDANIGLPMENNPGFFYDGSGGEEEEDNYS